jgi:hypothetical protein
MANSLLDFVISLVRDPDAAARYAANPAQSIVDAHLTNVTSADVNNLIPMVSDSLSMANPGGSAPGAPVSDHGNVWASGAAAAALDAFSPQAPAGVVHQHGPEDGVINAPPVSGPGETRTDPRPLVTDPHAPSVLVTGAEVPDATVDHGVFPAADPGGWDHSVNHPHTPHPNHQGFGIHG